MTDTFYKHKAEKYKMKYFNLKGGNANEEYSDTAKMVNGIFNIEKKTKKYNNNTIRKNKPKSKSKTILETINDLKQTTIEYFKKIINR